MWKMAITQKNCTLHCNEKVQVLVLPALSRIHNLTAWRIFYLCHFPPFVSSQLLFGNQTLLNITVNLVLFDFYLCVYLNKDFLLPLR